MLRRSICRGLIVGLLGRAVIPKQNPIRIAFRIIELLMSQCPKKRHQTKQPKCKRYR